MVIEVNPGRNKSTGSVASCGIETPGANIIDNRPATLEDDTKNGNQIDNEDLEDGEIESDDDNNSGGGTPLVIDVENSNRKVIQNPESQHPKKSSILEDTTAASSIISGPLASGKKAATALPRNDTQTQSTYASDVTVQKNIKSVGLGAGGGREIGKTSTAAILPTSKSSMKKLKRKRPDYVEDDFAGNIENAIAAALKRDGIEPPPLPKIEKRGGGGGNDHHHHQDNKPETESKSNSSGSKNRKRKRHDSEKEKRKKKRQKLSDDHQLSSSPPIHHASRKSDNDDEDIDDYEMLCVRGGSPPPVIGPGPTSNRLMDEVGVGGGGGGGPGGLHHPSPYYESDDSYSSYDSFDSGEYRKMSYEERRQNRRDKDRRKRKTGGIGGGASTSRGGGGGDRDHRRRNRDDSDGDNCQRSHEGRPQRKLELCKFYLMECCAKREKCLYMHADFPCKYYYLGMECIYKDACKFSHGKPLTDQLRNILLKHIETAPKEILGNFRRIGRENATQLIIATHSKICEEYGIENTLATSSSTTTVSVTTATSGGSGRSTSGSKFNCPNGSNQNDQGNGNGGGNNNNNISISSIPSLLDIIIKPPIVSPRKNDTSIQMGGGCKTSLPLCTDKPRKSRWCDSVSSTITTATTTATTTVSSIQSNIPLLTNNLLPSMTMNTSTAAATSGNAAIPGYLSLQTLTGILTQEQVEKMAAFGIESLEQINQLTMAQLNHLGLSIGQIHEIQLNTLNIQKLGLIGQQTSTNPQPTGISQQQISIIPTSSPQQPVNVAAIDFKTNLASLGASATNSATTPANQDIDMRFLPSSAIKQPSIGTSVSGIAESSTNETSVSTNLVDAGIASPDPVLPPPPATTTTANTKSEDLLDKDQRVLRTTTNTRTDQETTTSVSTASSEVVDYSQYLKDSHLDPDKEDLDDILSDVKDELLNEDEPELLIDESWCPSDEESKDIEKRYCTGLNNDSRDNNDSDDGDDRSQSSVNSQPIMPAIYDPKSLLPSRILYGLGKTIDISKSVQQLLTSISDKGEISTVMNENKDNSQNTNQTEPISMNKRIDPRLNIANSSNTTNMGINSSDSIVNSSNNSYYSRTLSLSNYENSNSQQDDNDDSRDNMPRYHRSSIYDGIPKQLEEEAMAATSGSSSGIGTTSSSKADKDMRMSSFLGQLTDSFNCDIDLRLPFKPVMTNYTPATEIDGSITSHAPIIYKVHEIDIPKPDYSEIRRNIPVTYRTLDPRLRRIFCLKESMTGDGNSSDDSILPATNNERLSSTGNIGAIQSQHFGLSQLSVPSGPRIDPRRKKAGMLENSGASGGNTGGATIATAASGNTSGSGSGNGNIGPNLDIRVLLQSSDWYKNLNSKYKIMVNQQLALVSTELKKFHQDTSQNKVFDMQFIATNQYLQQILTNLGIFIDATGQILQLDNNDGDLDNNGLAPVASNNGNMPQNLLNMMGLVPPSVGVGGGGGPGHVDFLRGPPPMNLNQQRLRGAGGLNSQNFGNMPARFGDNRPGLLGMGPPGMAMTGNFNMNTAGNFFGAINDQMIGSGGVGGGLPQLGSSGGSGGPSTSDYRSSNNSGNNNSGGNRNNRNYRPGGGNNQRSNDRWSGNSGGGGGSNRNNRRNYDSRNNGRDSRHDKAQK